MAKNVRFAKNASHHISKMISVLFQDFLQLSIFLPYYLFNDTTIPGLWLFLKQFTIVLWWYNLSSLNLDGFLGISSVNVIRVTRTFVGPKIANCHKHFFKKVVTVSLMVCNYLQSSLKGFYISTIQYLNIFAVCAFFLFLVFFAKKRTYVHTYFHIT